MSDQEICVENKSDEVAIAERLRVKMGPFVCFWYGGNLTVATDLNTTDNLVVFPKSSARIIVKTSRRHK